MKRILAILLIALLALSLGGCSARKEVDASKLVIWHDKEDAVVEAGAVVGAPPDDSPGWGIAVVAGGVTVGEKATVTPSAMVREDVKGGERV